MRIYLIFFMLLTTANAYAASIGTVIFSQGKIFSTSASSQTKVLTKGSQIETGDTIKTEADAMLQITMIDGAKFALQPNTTFKVDDYVYNGSEDDTERAFFSLVKGALRTVTGAIGKKNKQNYSGRTPTATIGVRGTEYALRFDGITLVTVGDGAISICNQSNCLDLDAGQSGIVLNQDAAPKLTDKTVLQEDRNKESTNLADRNQEDTSEEDTNQANRNQEDTSEEDTNQANRNQEDISEKNSIQGDSILEDVIVSIIAEDNEDGFELNNDAQSETLVVAPLAPPEAPVAPPEAPVAPPALPVANNIPLVSGTGNLNIFLQASGSTINAGLTGSNMVFDANGVLTSYRDTTTPTVGGDIITNAENYGDGIIAWGRWSSGLYQTGSVPLPINTFSYTAALNTTSTPAAVLSTLVGTYTAFGSSSPIVVDSNGTTIELGSPNTVIGSLNVNFVAGTVGYSLIIPLPSQTFTMSGIANFINNSAGSTDSRFLGAGSITSTGSACGQGCFGVIPTGFDIAGTIVGLNGERAGVIYGFSSLIGKVSGSVVFKP